MKDWDDDEFLGPTKTEQALVDQQVIQAFQENVRIRKGRLEVPLIFNEDCEDNLAMVMKRLESLKKKLKKDPKA
ncbi:hypothetical protein L596_013667 [Steinernema carpocapsae]|uniref:Uncharacterized protein n=1 Tax=Steinernema carpocapsae TaxID=34508 RepID=A0A4U5P0W1_STECR|nr:hypothetical protein L596_013667 [Steinernema carpocapsae]